MSIDAAAQTGHVFPTSDHLSAEIGWEVPQAKAQAKDIGMFAADEPSFWDLLDVVNPLQHIPIVNTLYRELTGDEIGVAARLAGGTLFGGPIGFAAAAVNAAVEQDTGKDIGGHVLAMFSDEEAPAAAEPPTAVAAAPAEAVAVAEPRGGEDVAPAYLPNVAAMEQPSGGMMFSVGGPVADAIRPPAAVEPVVPAVSSVAMAEPARFFPVPPRTAGTGGRHVPEVKVPVSNSGTRSNVPVTGLSPAPARVPVTNAAPQAAPEPRDAAWFGSAMKAGLDKYEQAARLNRGQGATEPVTLQ